MTDEHDKPFDRLQWAVEEIQRRRRRAYAHPDTGSDPIFAKAVRLAAMGRKAESEAVQAQAVQRFNDIQAAFPMPPDSTEIDTPKLRTTLSMRQARLYLQELGLLEQVDSLVEQLGEAARIEWQFAATVEMSSPLVAALSQELGLTPTDVQTMFEDAAEL